MSSERKKEETNTPDVTELRKKFIAEAKEAEYRKNGLHVTLDEWSAWIG